ncbi:MAG: DUF167 domain-containing protein [Chloroflexota bacterium]
MAGGKDPDTVRIAVLLTPRGGADRIDGVVEGRLRVRVAAAPVDGAANEALLRVIAAELGVPRTSLRLVSGGTGRRKVIEVFATGIRAAVAARRPDLLR